MYLSALDNLIVVDVHHGLDSKASSKLIKFNQNP